VFVLTFTGKTEREREREREQKPVSRLVGSLLLVTLSQRERLFSEELKSLPQAAIFVYFKVVSNILITLLRKSIKSIFQYGRRLQNITEECNHQVAWFIGMIYIPKIKNELLPLRPAWNFNMCLSVHRLYTWRRKPTRCSIVYWSCNLLNMFRALICPSSGARDYTFVTACGV
jgi:hypothetical protein